MFLLRSLYSVYYDQRFIEVIVETETDVVNFGYILNVFQVFVRLQGQLK